MSTSFPIAFSYMLENEDPDSTGEVTDEPNGGKARFGINSIFHPEAVKAGFYEMEQDQGLRYAKGIYLKVYWNGRGFATIANQQVATKLFDTAVNMGNGGELEVLQKTLAVPITHRMDAATQEGLASIGDNFLSGLVVNLKKRYQEIYDANPEKYKNVIAGWLTRAERLPTPL